MFNYFGQKPKSTHSLFHFYFYLLDCFWASNHIFANLIEFMDIYLRPLHLVFRELWHINNLWNIHAQKKSFENFPPNPLLHN